VARAVGGVAAIAVVLAVAVPVAPVEAARIYDPGMLPQAHYTAPLLPWPQPSYRAKDFTILKKGAYYHLFYTRVQRFVPDHWSDGTRTVLNETTFGHALSANLETWFDLDSVLAVSQDTTRWDAHHLWAPSVFEFQDTTWMYFTGVRDRKETSGPASWIPRWQVLGAAYSTDPLLQQWVRLPNPVWEPFQQFGLPGVVWAVCSPTQPGLGADFRDPFVLPPSPGSGDPWLLYYTARVRTDQFNYVAGVARANGPRGPWTDLGALWDTYYPPLNSKVESPHVFRRGNDWHLMFTGDDGSTGIAWHTAHGSPVGPWTARPALNEFLKDAPDSPYKFVLEPEAWFASEHFSESTPSGTAEYLAVVHSYDAPTGYNPPAPAPPDDISIVEFRRMQWDAPGFSYTLLGPNPVRSLTLSHGSAVPGETVDLAFRCDGGAGRVADLTVTLHVGGQAIPVLPLEVGLPATVALGDPVVHVPWTVQTAGYTPPFLATVTIASQPLQCAVQLDVASGGGAVDVDPIVRRPGGRLGLVARGATGSSLEGGGPVLEVELPAATRARLALHDVTGRQVRTLVDETLPEGVSTHRWDGRDDAGRMSPPGLYFARLRTEFGARTARVLAFQ
jgi:hypothetical protein